MTNDRAAIIAIGSEMLGPLRRDTNSLWLTERLEQAGIPVVRKSIVGDEADEIGSLSASAEALRLTAAAPPRNQNIGPDYE